MDLTNLIVNSASEDGAKCEIVHPVTERSFDPPVYITVVGIDSELYQKASRELTNKRLKKATARGRFKLTATAEELEAEHIELLARCTVGWENIEWEGKPLPFDKDNAKKLYTKAPWLREQVDLFMGDRANFLAS